MSVNIVARMEMIKIKQQRQYKEIGLKSKQAITTVQYKKRDNATTTLQGQRNKIQKLQ